MLLQKAIHFFFSTKLKLFTYLFSFFKFKFIYFNWRLITLQYCIGFAIYQHASATGVHLFPILNLHPHTIPLGHPSAPAPNILYPASNLDWWFVSYMIYYTCFNAILPSHPTLALSHRVQKTVLYICVSIAVSQHQGNQNWKRHVYPNDHLILKLTKK